jgi:hypothetical protein
MLSTASSNKFTSAATQVIDVWRQLDPRHNRLVKLRTEAARQKLQGEIRIETIQIRFNNRENLNSGIIPNQILAMNLRKIDELAAQYYSIYSEVWELRGNEKSAALGQNYLQPCSSPTHCHKKNFGGSRSAEVGHRNRLPR